MSTKLKEWERPENQVVYKGFNVYSGKKSGEGFIPEMVDWLIDAVDLVGYLHHRPVAFHVILEEASFTKLVELPKFLKRFVKYKPEEGYSDEVFYQITHEIRPINKESHSHLLVFMDNLSPRERLNIQYDLVAQGYAKKAKVACRKRNLFPADWQGSVWYHSIRVEPDDLILRASYLAKHATKDKAKVRRWSGSHLPKIKPMHVFPIVTSQNIKDIELETLPLLGLAINPSHQEAVQNL